MSQTQDFFDDFQPHTLLKIRILEAYLGAWAMKLIQWGGAGRTLYYIDGFAGPGGDKQGRPGSPVVATRIALRTQAHLRERIPEATMRVIAIEKLAGLHKSLKEVADGFDVGERGVLRALRGELPDHIDALLAETQGAPTLSFLDPYGVKGLDASTYPKLLSGPCDEMFVLFHEMGAGRLHGVVLARADDIEGQVRDLRATPSLFAEWDDDAERVIRERAAERAEALDLTRPGSRDALRRALGDIDLESELERIPVSDRPDAFLRLFIRRLIDSGAGYVLTLPMRDDDGHRVYSLVYASKSAKGFVTMKEAITTSLNSNVLAAEVCEMIRDDLRVSIPQLVDDLARRFAGRELRWTGDGGLQSFVLQNTALFHFQKPELLEALTSAGYVPRGRTGKPKTPILVSFPALDEIPVLGA